jgi:hypothetical protein
MENIQRPTLRFGADGTFTVMQISDIQDINHLRARTQSVLETALDCVKPDFAVLSGDQIKGYSPLMHVGGQTRKATQITGVLDGILALFHQRNIPFTFVFGNHDHDAPMPGEAQIHYYQRSPLCLVQHNPEVPGFANHAIPVLRAAADSPALLFYFLDSHRSKGMGYCPLLPEQVEWYRATRDTYAAANGGLCVPSLLFQHIPVEEMNELYRAVPQHTKGALEGFRNYAGKFFVLDESKTSHGGFMGELPSSPDENAGLFDAAAEKGDMLGMFFGHDHSNGFHGTVRGIQLGYAPGVGFNAYGPGRNRGVRVFRFREADIRAFETYVLTDEQLLGQDKRLALSTRMRDIVPTSFGAAKPLVRKGALGASLGFAAASGGIIAAKLIEKAIKRR